MRWKRIITGLCGALPAFAYQRNWRARLLRKNSLSWTARYGSACCVGSAVPCVQIH